MIEHAWLNNHHNHQPSTRRWIKLICYQLTWAEWSWSEASAYGWQRITEGESRCSATSRYVPSTPVSRVKISFACASWLYRLVLNSSCLAKESNCDVLDFVLLFAQTTELCTHMNKLKFKKKRKKINIERPWALLSELVTTIRSGIKIDEISDSLLYRATQST